MENAAFEYASVYLLDVPYCIDGSYDYFIPLEMRADVEEGVFVTVPFGRGNRKQMGIVRKLHHHPDYDDLKTISTICSDRPKLSGEMLSLCEFMKEQWLCTFGEAVRCTVPAGVLGKMEQFYYPTPDKKGPSSTTGYTTTDLFVYNSIFESGGKTLDSLKAKYGAGVATEAVEKLLSKGFIKKKLMTGKTMNELFEDVFYLEITPVECRDLLEGKGELKLRSEKHKMILRALMEEDGISGDELKQRLDVGQVQFKALMEKGLIRTDRRRVWRRSYETMGENRAPISLNDEQNEAFVKIKRKISEDKAGAVLLHGVTGSGKTSVIISAIDHALDSGKGVIMLLPEIALTPQTLKIFNARYGDRIALVHSGLSAGERHDSYQRINEGVADLVIGTRSAIFSPVKNLGLVIIDEEHETTYKSETSPKYHARDIARWRCVHNNAIMLLASATPAIESYTKALEGKYTLIKLRHRYGEAELPDVKIYDMRNELKTGNQSPLGLTLKNELLATVDRGEQAILFLNRRGYNTSVGCKSCGDTLNCPNCSISLNYHTKRGGYDRGFLFCHWCGYKTFVPDKCPSCGSEHLQKVGFGTQRIEQELEELLPGKRILRMDADSTSEKHSLDKILADFKEHKADVLLGTQMVTKGHDFPDVTLVGVLLADMSLYMDDYHANERTFSMLTQVIGRAGRSKKKGMAVIQTNNPDNDTVRLACKQDYEAFYASEIRLRKLLVFPPYCDVAVLTVMGENEQQVNSSITQLRGDINMAKANGFNDVEMIVFGPFESPVYKVEGKYRMRIVIKCRLNRHARELFSNLLSNFVRNTNNRLSLSIDFNPTGL